MYGRAQRVQLRYRLAVTMLPDEYTNISPPLAQFSDDTTAQVAGCSRHYNYVIHLAQGRHSLPVAPLRYVFRRVQINTAFGKEYRSNIVGVILNEFAGTGIAGKFF